MMNLIAALEVSSRDAGPPSPTTSVPWLPCGQYDSQIVKRAGYARYAATSDRCFTRLNLLCASGGEREYLEDHVRGEQGCDVRVI